MVRAVGESKIHSNWSASAGQLVFTRDNASVGITWGEDGSGIDTTWFGETADAKMQWIVSADELYIVNAEARIASASFAGDIVVTGEADVTSASITNIIVTGNAVIASASFSSNIVVTGEAKLSSASVTVLSLTAASVVAVFADGATTSTMVAAASAPAGFINIGIGAASTRRYVPYYASA